MANDEIGSTTGKSGANATSLRIQSIKISSLMFFMDQCNQDHILPIEVKRTTRAKLSKIEIPDWAIKPLAILPASGSGFGVKMDHNKEFIFSKHVPKNPEPYSAAVYPQSITESMSFKLDEKQTADLFKQIAYLNTYFSELLNRTDESQSKKHVLVPADLYQAVINLEGLFSSGMDSGSLVLVKSSMASLRTFVKSQSDKFTTQISLVSQCVAEANQEERTTPTLGNRDFPIPSYDRKDWNAAKMANIYNLYLGQSSPNMHNKPYVDELLKNLVFDALLHNPEDWISGTSIGSLTVPTLDLGPRLAMDSDLEKKAQMESSYENVVKKLRPIKGALEEQKRQNQSGDLEESINYCVQIEEHCNTPIDYKKIIQHSPEQLTSQVSLLTEKHNLTSVMKDEIKAEFPALYEAHTSQSGKGKKIDQLFFDLKELKYDFDECDRLLKFAREFVSEKSVLRDVGTIRETAQTRINEFKVGLRDDKKQKATLEDLATSARTCREDIERWFEELKDSLSGGGEDQSLLWIGLGQAGGQILRECISFCLSNLSDARCSALLTALGVTKKDKKELYSEMKNIHSKDDKKRLSAENSLKTVFDEKVHLLAINLGEEIDKLAKSDAPGYYFWGKKFTADKASKTVRTRRNILKLIEDGKGAGGSTGIGRAYGFRFEQDITDAMKDVGKKGNRTPEHIVITHSLSGGSGSGMVLPVLERARKTFGEKPVIWVISVGEGSSEEKATAKVNTPFIISDILQAHYDGIHAIRDPIELSHFRRFNRQVVEHMSKMHLEAQNLLDLFIPEESQKSTRFTNLSHLLKGGSRTTRGSDMLDSFRNAMEKMGPVSQIAKGSGIKDKMVPFIPLQEETAKEIIGTEKISHSALDLLPDTAEASKAFSQWCTDEGIGGVRPGVAFWTTWLEIQRDPFSLLLRGKEYVKKTESESEDTDRSTNHFEPELTGDQLRTVVRRLYHEKNLKLNSKVPDVKTSKAGLDPLYVVLESKITDKTDKDLLDKIREIIDTYARSLDSFNSVIAEMDQHILSLSGSGSDVAVKSIIVSNRHLERGVEQSGHIKVAGDAYTVFNSVIFDLMLNIIGPRLPVEPGVYINTDSEEFDHADMLGHTAPPLVVGLLNQRDSVSLSEKITLAKPENYDAEVSFLKMLSSLISSEFLNPGDTQKIENLAFLCDRPGQKYMDLFSALFGSRYKYMLETNPFEVITHLDMQRGEIDSFCEELVDLWDTSQDVILDTTKNERQQLSQANGIAGLHIGNLVRWYSLIEGKLFCNFISRDLADGVEVYATLQQRPNALWNLNKDVTRKFDIGVMRTANSLQRYDAISEKIDQKNLEKVFAKMGILNAELLRAVAPAYLNSFLPLAVLDEEFIQENEAKRLDELFNILHGNRLRTLNSDEEKEDSGEALTVSSIVTWLIDVHSYDLNGKLILDTDDKSDFETYKSEIHQTLSSMNLQLVWDGGDAYIRLHPRVERYMSVLRDIPSDTSDHYLPSRSAPASLARYLYSNSDGSPLDPNPSGKNQTGIASPTFTMGLDRLNQLRLSTLLPDEMRLSFVPLLRILLLSPQSSKQVLAYLKNQMKSSGIPENDMRPHFEKVLDENQYRPLDAYSDPASYCWQILTTVNRLHDISDLLDELKTNVPSNWSSNDIAGIDFIKQVVLKADTIVYESKEAAQGLLGNNLASVSELGGWTQEVINLVVKEMNSNDGDSSDTEGVVSNQNPTIVKIKQLFYDISTLTSEGLRQAEYLSKDSGGSSRGRSVHFEMTGFSDRLLGEPDGLMMLVHDRNPSLPMNKIKQNSREAMSHFIANFPNPKEYSTAADFGPNSFLTMVLTRAPAADVADQFYDLMHNRATGLGGDDSFWPFKESKLHPYIFLYNTLWLSVNSIGTWSRRTNKFYARRFQIPSKVIDLHYANPKTIESNRKRIEGQKSDFPGDIFMPKKDHLAYANSIKMKVNRHSGHRNLIKLIGIMALRHDHLESEKEHWKNILSQNQYNELKKIVPDSEYTGVEEGHLIESSSDANHPNPPPKKRKRLGGRRNTTTPIASTDTIETRAKAWFKAYKAWIEYTPEESSSEAPTRSNVVGFQADQFPSQPETTSIALPENNDSDGSTDSDASLL